MLKLIEKRGCDLISTLRAMKICEQVQT